jgi:hypothetical protein
MLRSTIIAIAIATPIGAAAQQNCSTWDQVTGHLAQEYSETQQNYAMGASGALVEMYANTVTGSWSLLVTQPGGATCLIGSGFGFQITATPAGTDS